MCCQLILETACCSAGSDFVHQCYLVGEIEQGTEGARPDERSRKFAPLRMQRNWGGEDLHWANLEMHPAPPVDRLENAGQKLYL